MFLDGRRRKGRGKEGKESLVNNVGYTMKFSAIMCVFIYIYINILIHIIPLLPLVVGLRFALTLANVPLRFTLGKPDTLR